MDPPSPVGVGPVETVVFGGIALYVLAISQPRVSAVLVLLLACTLAGSYRRYRASHPPWFEQLLSAQPAPGRRAGLELRRAMRTVLTGTAVFLVVLFLIRMAGRRLFTAQPPDPLLTLLFYALNIFLSMLTQVAVGIRVTAATADHSWIDGYSAAFTVACLTSVVILALNVRFGGAAGPDFSWWTFSYAVNCGAPLALPAILLTSALTNRTRARRRLKQRKATSP